MSPSPYTIETVGKRTFAIFPDRRHALEFAWLFFGRLYSVRGKLNAYELKD